jgi:glycosyltransferase involved in cell wall biosynthesis
LHSAFGRIERQVEAFRRWLERGLKAYRGRFGEPDAIFACAALPAGWACTHLDDRLASRVVLLEMTGPFSLIMRPQAGEAFVRAAMATAGIVVAASERSRAEMHSFGIDRRISVCGSPVADEFTTPIVSTKSDTDRLRAIFVGRIVREKGVMELAEAAAVLEREFDIEWHWVGAGPMADWVRQRFAQAGLSDRLTMHSMLDRRGVVESLAAASLFVLPTHGETFGQAVAEALCMGLPVVTTRGTACEEFVDAASGVLVDIGSTASLVEGLRQLVGRISSYARSAIAERARRRFSGAAVAAKYAELFRAVCGEK